MADTGASRAAGAAARNGPFAALARHWPEYLIEGWALGTFMVSAALFTTLLEASELARHPALADADLRRALIGLAMGITAVLLIYSPWGQRSGAHMNPAVTLTFWRLGRVAGWDAFFYVFAQFAGATAGVLVAAGLLGPRFTAAPVRYVVTLPGEQGVMVALTAELLMAAGMMATVLVVSNNPRVARLAGLCAGALVAAYITFEAPLSGMSINPARSFGSALPAGEWAGYWIYLVAPPAGMLLAAFAYSAVLRQPLGCAKLLHPADQRCIHCGHDPSVHGAPTTAERSPPA